MPIPISHITHLHNLASIIAEDCLWSDSQRIKKSLDNQNIGYSHIKERRRLRPVKVANRGTIGQYVPFNFCPRSVMLFVIHKGHQDYTGGQEHVLHLISDVDTLRASNPHCFFTLGCHRCPNYISVFAISNHVSHAICGDDFVDKTYLVITVSLSSFFKSKFQNVLVIKSGVKRCCFFYIGNSNLHLIFFCVNISAKTKKDKKQCSDIDKIRRIGQCKLME